jgi:DNA-binding HxlR family transcriptional regulator
MTASVGPDAHCSIGRTLASLGEKWTLLIVRDAFMGRTRFSEFRESLGVAPDVLSARLATLVELGVLERRAYRDAGARERHEYLLTPKGRELHYVIAGLAGWGKDHLPVPDGGTSPRYSDAATGEPVELCFVTADGRRLAPDAVAIERAAVAPA